MSMVFRPTSVGLCRKSPESGDSPVLTRRATRALLSVLLWLCLVASAAAEQWLDQGLAPPAKADAALARWIADVDGISLLELEGDYDKTSVGGEANSEPRRELARAFFASHADVYDFLITFTTFEFDSGDALAFYTGVRNDVGGIGRTIFDSSALYGSDGRLQGFIDMAATSRYVLDPLDADFESVMRTLAHEIQHQWGVDLDAGPFGERLVRPDGHWSASFDSDGSVRYGHGWSDLGDGTRS